MEAYSLLALKLLMGILGLILQINLLGKGNLAPTSAMDQVQNYVLGGIIGGVIYSDSVGLLQFFLVLILWTLLVLSLKFIKNHNRWVKSVIDGKSVWIIVNSTRLFNGMIIGIKNQYYEVHFNQDFSAYTLTPINLVNNNIELIDKE